MEQRRIISLGYPVGRVDESGDWIPRTQNPLTGQWEDIEPGEILDALLETEYFAVQAILRSSQRQRHREDGRTVAVIVVWRSVRRRQQ